MHPLGSPARGAVTAPCAVTEGSPVLYKPGAQRSGSGFERKPKKPTRTPAKRVRVGKEDGRSGYGAFAALTETAKAECSEFRLTIVLYKLESQRSGFKFERKPKKPTRTPAKRVRVGKEDGRSGYGAFAALTETAKAECSEFRLTRGCNGFDGGVEAGIAGGCAQHP